MPAMNAHEHEKPGLDCEAENTRKVPDLVGGDVQPDTPIEQVNRLYQAYRDRGRRKTREEAGSKNEGRKKKRGRTGTIPPALRKKVMLRDGGCCPPCGGRQVPGCGRSHHVEVHHLMPLGAGGDHVPEGLLVLCSSCHKNVHEGRLSIEGTLPGRLIFRRV